MMLHDVYQNGQVLQRRKYRFLGYAYRMFIAGLRGHAGRVRGRVRCWLYA